MTLLRFWNQPYQELSHFPSPDVFALESFSLMSVRPLTWREIRMRKRPLFGHSLCCTRKQDNNSCKCEVFLFCISFFKAPWAETYSNSGEGFSESGHPTFLTLAGSYARTRFIFGWKTTAVLEAVSHWDVTRPGLNISPCFSHGGYRSSETASQSELIALLLRQSWTTSKHLLSTAERVPIQLTGSFNNVSVLWKGP